MSTVNISEAKRSLSRLVGAVESGRETEIIITRNGKPVAKLVGASVPVGVRLGVARGRFIAPEVSPSDDEEIAAMFLKAD